MAGVNRDRKEYFANYRNANRQKLLEKDRVYREQNKEKIKLYSIENKEILKNYNAEYRKNNRDKELLRHCRWYFENKARVLSRRRYISKKQRECLDSVYIAKTLGFNLKNIPMVFIEFQRVHIQIKRFLKGVKNVCE